MWRLTAAKARRDCSKDVAGGGGEDVRPPCGFRAPEAREGQNSGGSNRNPHRRHELCAATDKKARQGSRDPSDHLDPPKKQGPSNCRGPLAIRDPPNCQGPLIIRDPSEHQEPSDHQGPSDHHSD